MKALATVLLAVFVLCSCSDDACLSHTGRICAEGAVYWLDSCGNYQELIEECRCGCKSAAPECKRCDDCTCDLVDTCCDGCLPQNDGEFCDDGDPGTRLDLCKDGACAGFEFLVEEPAQPAEPAAPAPAGLQSWTCPADWVAVDHQTLGFSWCEPPPLPRLRLGTYITPMIEGEQNGDRPVCEPEVDGTFPVLGRDTCQPLGDPCPAGDWPEIPPEVTGNRVYVLAGAVNGDGTQGAPFGTIGEAIDAAAAGDVVAIGAGIYPELVSITKDLTLWGKCVTETVISAPDPGGGLNAGAVRVPLAARVSLRNLQITGEQYGLVLNWDMAQVSLEGVWVHQATQAGINAQLGTLILRDVLVDSTKANAAGLEGMGIVASSGVRLTASATTLEHNRYVGLRSFTPGTTLDLQDLVIRNTESQQADASYGRGLEIGFGVQAVINRGLFEYNHELAVMVTSANASLQLQDALVRYTRYSDFDGSGGMGVWVQYGATATLARVLLERNRYNAIGVDGEGTDLQLEDVAVLDTRTDYDDEFLGRAALVERGANMGCRRCLFEESRAVGITVIDAGTRLTLEDSVVSYTYSSGLDGLAGMGLWALTGSSVTLDRVLFEENRQLALAFGDPETVADISDLTVRTTRGEYGTGLDGTGLLAIDGCQVTLDRGLFEGNRSSAIDVRGSGTLAQISDVTARMTHGQQLDRKFGWGLHVAGGARVELIRGLLDRNSDAGMVVYQPGTVVLLEDLTVRDTLSSQHDRSGGGGLYALEGSSVTCTRCRFEGNRHVAVYGQDDGTSLTLEDLTVLDTHSQFSDGMAGYGLAAALGATATLTRGRIEGSHSTGVGASWPGARLVLQDVTVAGTRSREADLYMGRGLEVNLGASAEVTDARFEQNRDVSILAYSPDTQLALTRVVISDTLERECADGSGPFPCEGFGYGTGLGALHEATVTLEGVEIETSSLAGMQLARQGTASGRAVSLKDNPIGVNVQETPTGYDFFESVTGLLMENNQTNFDTTNLPIPDLLDIGQ